MTVRPENLLVQRIAMIHDVFVEALRVRRALVEGVRRSDGSIAGPVRPGYVEDSAEGYRTIYGPRYASFYLTVVGRRARGNTR